jgi:hypothetical protein
MEFAAAEHGFRAAAERWHQVAAVVIALAAAQGVGQHRNRSGPLLIGSSEWRKKAA